jgi:hypothetical protein
MPTGISSMKYLIESIELCLNFSKQNTAVEVPWYHQFVTDRHQIIPITKYLTHKKWFIDGHTVTYSFLTLKQISDVCKHTNITNCSDLHNIIGKKSWQNLLI